MECEALQRVLLIDMPFGEIRCPSLALGLFKSRLESEGIGCDVEYLNLLFGRSVGWNNYVWLAPLTSLLAGERMFARVYFGRDIASDAEYFSWASAYITPDETRRLQSMARCVVPFLQTCIANIPWRIYDVIGFTSMFEQNVASLALAYEVKRRFPHKVIVLGGANCEGVMGLTIHRCFPFVDFVCCGEADQSFPELVRRLARGSRVDDVPGIVFRAHGCSVSTRPSGGMADLDALPVPDYADYFRALHAYQAPAWLDPSVLMETSRGCWWGQKTKCTFCGLNGSNARFRSKSPARVLHEITWMVQQYNASYIRAVDNVLGSDYFDTLLPELARRNSGVRFFFEIRPTLRKEQVKMLASAGVGDVQVGIENLSTHVLHLMKKGASSLAGIQTLKWCKQYGIYADWNILFGFAGEQPADYARNLELVQLLTHLDPPSGVGPFRMDRFSTNFDKAAEMGFTDVRPHLVYRFIYPFSEKTLSNLVYFFDYQCQTKIDDGGCAGPLFNEVSAWKTRHDQLSCAQVGDSLVVYDTRPVAIAPQTVLRGIRRNVIEYCDRAHTIDQLCEGLRKENKSEVTAKEIEAVLDELVRNRLMVKEGSWYLSLPVMTHIG